MAKPALGRGLGALLGGSTTGPSPAPPPAPPEALGASGERVLEIAVRKVQPCTFQPRKDFSAASLQELADSIREQGIVQPLLVRRSGENFELIAGERRWRAAQMAGLATVPVIIRDADDRTVLELALIENLQRENLNPIEEALGYSQLIDQFQLKQEEAAVKVGKSRTVVTNALRLLKLDPQLQTHVREGRLSVGHAKVLLGLADLNAQKNLGERIIRDQLSVRQTEDLLAVPRKVSQGTSTEPGQVAAVADLHTLDVQNKLQEKLGTKVHLRYRNGKGSIDIRFYNDADLERILKLIGVELD